MFVYAIRNNKGNYLVDSYSAHFYNDNIDDAEIFTEFESVERAIRHSKRLKELFEKEEAHVLKFERIYKPTAYVDFKL